MKSLALLFTVLISAIPENGGACQEAQNNACWIKECQGDRLYIHADRLEITGDLILIKDAANISYPLTHIFVDSSGIFTTARSMSETELATVWNIVWCRTCNAYRSVDIAGLCVKCGNQP
jgi:hypothetical protein